MNTMGKRIYMKRTENGMTKVLINAKGTVGDITPELKKFLKMVSRHEALNC